MGEDEIITEEAAPNEEVVTDEYRYALAAISADLHNMTESALPACSYFHRVPTTKDAEICIDCPAEGVKPCMDAVVIDVAKRYDEAKAK